MTYYQCVAKQIGARSAAFALGLVLVTLIGHTAAQGALPDFTGLVVMAALAFVTSMLVMSRKRSSVVVFSYLLAGQFALHLVATLTGAHGTDQVHASVTAMMVTHSLLALVLTFVAQHMDRIVEALRSLGRTILGRGVPLVLVRVRTHRGFATQSVFPGSYSGYSPHSRRGPPLLSCA